MLIGLCSWVRWSIKLVYAPVDAICKTVQQGVVQGTRRHASNNMFLCFFMFLFLLLAMACASAALLLQSVNMGVSCIDLSGAAPCPSLLMSTETKLLNYAACLHSAAVAAAVAPAAAAASPAWAQLHVLCGLCG
jgi:hypothetical protein